MGLWDRWFGPEARKRREARSRINGYFSDVYRAIKNGRSELTLTAVRSRQVVEPAGDRWHPLLPTFPTVYTDVEADFEIRHEGKDLVGSLHFYLGDMSDGYFCEGTFVNLEGVRLDMEYRGVIVLMDAVEKRARARLKAQQAEQSQKQDQAELRVAGALPRR